MDYLQGLLMGLSIGMAPMAYALGAQKGVQQFMASRAEVVRAFHEAAVDIWARLTKPKENKQNEQNNQGAAAVGSTSGLRAYTGVAFPIPQKAKPRRKPRKTKTGRIVARAAAKQKHKNARASRSTLGQKTRRIK